MCVACAGREPRSPFSFPPPDNRPQSKPRLLIIDDEEPLIRGLTLHFEEEYDVCAATSGSRGLTIAEAALPDCVLLDLGLPDMNGLGVLKGLQRLTPAPLVIIITGNRDISSAVQAVKHGAVDYVTKPLDIEKLRHDLHTLLWSKPQALLRDCSGLVVGERRIIGQGPQMQKVWDAVEKFAPTDIPIVLYGESGTGKELVARAIHALSKRAQGPFVPVDCAAVPESLWESEFFGYEKGAFTGAAHAKPGLFTLAHGGTLFLDEIGNLPLALQAKLLRALQEREVRPLGAKKPVACDVRVVAAANADLAQMAAHGTFRADLYYRLSAVTVSLPPLRRREDLPLLIRYFLDLYGRHYGKRVGISQEALALLTRYQWPGNCRELENVLRSSLLLAEREILPVHLPVHVQRNGEEGSPSRTATADDHGDSRAASQSQINVHIAVHINLEHGTDLKKIGTQVAQKVERAIIKKAQSFGMSQAEMASLFHIDPKTLRARLKPEKNCDFS